MTEAAPLNERRILFHLLRKPEHAAMIEEVLTQVHFQDVNCQWAFTLLLYWRTTQGYALTLDSALQQVSTRVNDRNQREALSALLLGLTDFEGSTRQDLEHAISEIDREHRRRRVLELASLMSEKLARTAGEGDISQELHGLFEVTNPDSHGGFRSTRDAGEVYARAYAEVKASTVPIGVSTGFSRVDALTAGFRKKRLYILAGFTSHGKTKLAQEVAYHFGREGRRVLFVSLEMDEEDLMLGIYARRTHDIVKAVGLPGISPLQVEAIRAGKLNEAEEVLYSLARRDVDKFDIMVWVPGDVSISDIGRRVQVEQLHRPVDLVIIDYLSLCKPERARGTDREEGVDLMRHAKRLARREVVPVLALHQISREGYENGLLRGHYILTDLAQTSEVERNADGVLWTMLTDEMRAANELRFGMMKNRFGPLLVEGYQLYQDFATAIISENPSAKEQMTPDFFRKFLP